MGLETHSEITFPVISDMYIVLCPLHLIQYQVWELPVDDVEKRIGELGDLNIAIYSLYP